MGGLLHLVQRGGDGRGCTKCNSQPVNSQCTNHRIAIQWYVVLRFNVPIKGLTC